MTSGDSEQPGQGPDIRAPAQRRGGGWGQLSIKVKLLTMLLATSILTALVVGFVAYRAGSDALEKAAFNQLTSIRESRAREITSYFQTLQDAQVVYTRGASAIDAVTEFSEAFQELAGETVAAAEQNAIVEWYEDFLVPELSANAGVPVDASEMLGMTSAQRYLQAHYTAAQTDYDEAILVDNAGDGSAWSEIHERYHDFFRQITLRFAYEDVLLLDTEGNIIYTAYKGFDLGANVRTGVLAGSSLQRAYDAVLVSNSVDFVALTDYERYPQPFGRPHMWTVSPVGRDGEIVGALALQLPLEAINDIMTHDGRWADEGLGRTGETFLVGRLGSEQLMRSISRFVLDDTEDYARVVAAAGTPADTAETMARVRGTVMLQPMRSAAVNAAISGQTGATTVTGYRGERVLSAYAPLSIGDLHWGILAEIDEEEAFAPVRSFARNLALATAALVLVLAGASILLAKAFSEPIRRLVAGIRRIGAGETDVAVEVTAGNEFGDLSTAFNDMSRSLTAKNELIDEQQAEYATMLRTVMPESVAERFQGGEEMVADDHANVSVVFADINGFDEFAAPLSSKQSAATLSELFAAFDDAAAQRGVERVRSQRQGYLVSCGLVVPRDDHVQRSVDFAQDMQRAVEVFNTQHSARLTLRAGIDTGAVSSGLLGNANVVYDMWGETVNLAYRVHETSGEPGIFVTDQVYDELRDSGAEFTEAGQLDAVDGARTVWLLRPARTGAEPGV